jgi:membrane-associated phospholipid phosphatase
LPSALLGTKRDLLDYVVAMAATCLIGLTIFYFWPSAVPPAAIDWTRYPSLDTLKTLDAGGNACPSLHVASAAFSLLWLQFILQRCQAPRWVHSFNWVWCAGIIYSTVALRQHVVLDVLGGLLLGGGLAYLSLRQRRPYVQIPL